MLFPAVHATFFLQNNTPLVKGEERGCAAPRYFRQGSPFLQTRSPAAATEVTHRVQLSRHSSPGAEGRFLSQKLLRNGRAGTSFDSGSGIQISLLEIFPILCSTSLAALSPACTAPSMYPLHCVAVSVPAK